MASGDVLRRLSFVVELDDQVTSQLKAIDKAGDDFAENFAETKKATEQMDDLAESGENVEKSFDFDGRTHTSLTKIAAGGDEVAKAFSPATAQLKLFKGALTAVGSVALGASAAVAGVAWQGARLSKRMATIEATTNATSDTMSDLREKITNIGAETPATVVNTAEAFKELSYAGLTANEIMQSGRDVVELATASQLEMGEAAKVTAQNLRAFNLRANQASVVSNTLASVFSGSATTVEALANGLSYVNATAEQLGFSLTETASALGVLADAGIEGTRGGTSLNQALSKMFSQTGQVKEALDAVGLSMQSFIDKQGNVKSLTQILSILKQRMDELNMPDWGRQAFAVDMFGRRGARAMLPLLNNTEKLNEKIENASFSQLKSELEALGLEGSKSIAQLEQDLLGQTDDQRDTFSKDPGIGEIVTELTERFGEGRVAARQMQEALMEAFPGMEEMGAKRIAETLADSHVSIQEFKNALGLSTSEASKLASELTQTEMKIRMVKKQMNEATTDGDIYREFMETVGGQVKYLQGTLSAIADEIFIGLAPALSSFLERLKAIASWIKGNEAGLRTFGKVLFWTAAAATTATAALAGLGGLALAPRLASYVAGLVGVSRQGGIVTRVMQGLSGTLTTLGAKFGGLLASFGSFRAVLKRIAMGAINPVAAGVSRLVGGLGGLLTAVGSASGVLGKLSAAGGFLLNVVTSLTPPLLALKIAIAAVAAITAMWLSDFKGFRSKTKPFIDGVQAAADGVVNFGNAVYNWGVWAVRNLMDWLNESGASSGFVDAMAAAANALGVLLQAGARVLHWIGRFVNVFGEIAWNGFAGKTDRLGSSFKELRDAIRGVGKELEGLWDLIPNLPKPPDWMLGGINPAENNQQDQQRQQRQRDQQDQQDQQSRGGGGNILPKPPDWMLGGINPAERRQEQTETPGPSRRQTERRGRAAGFGLWSAFAKGQKEGKKQAERQTRRNTRALGMYLTSSNAEKGALSNVTHRGTALMGTFAQGIRQGKHTAVTATATAMDRLSSALSDDDFEQKGADAFDRLIGKTDEFTPLVEDATEQTGDLTDATEGLFEQVQAVSNSRLNLSDVVGPLEGMWQWVKDNVLGLFDLTSWLSGLNNYDLSLDGVLGPLGGVADVVGTVAGGIEDLMQFLSNLDNWAPTWDNFRELYNNIAGGAEWAANRVEEALNDLLGGFNLFGDGEQDDQFDSQQERPRQFTRPEWAKDDQQDGWFNFNAQEWWKNAPINPRNWNIKTRIKKWWQKSNLNPKNWNLRFDPTDAFNFQFNLTEWWRNSRLNPNNWEFRADDAIKNWWRNSRLNPDNWNIRFDLDGLFGFNFSRWWRNSSLNPKNWDSAFTPAKWWQNSPINPLNWNLGFDLSNVFGFNFSEWWQNSSLNPQNWDSAFTPAEWWQNSSLNPKNWDLSFGFGGFLSTVRRKVNELRNLLDFRDTFPEDTNVTTAGFLPSDWGSGGEGDLLGQQKQKQDDGGVLGGFSIEIQNLDHVRNALDSVKGGLKWLNQFVPSWGELTGAFNRLAQYVTNPKLVVDDLLGLLEDLASLAPSVGVNIDIPSVEDIEQTVSGFADDIRQAWNKHTPNLSPQVNLPNPQKILSRGPGDATESDVQQAGFLPSDWGTPGQDDDKGRQRGGVLGGFSIEIQNLDHVRNALDSVKGGLQWLNQFVPSWGELTGAFNRLAQYVANPKLLVDDLLGLLEDLASLAPSVDVNIDIPSVEDIEQTVSGFADDIRQAWNKHTPNLSPNVNLSSLGDLFRGPDAYTDSNVSKAGLLPSDWGTPGQGGDKGRQRPRGGVLGGFSVEIKNLDHVRNAINDVQDGFRWLNQYKPKWDSLTGAWNTLKQKAKPVAGFFDDIGRVLRGLNQYKPKWGSLKGPLTTLKEWAKPAKNVVQTLRKELRNLNTFDLSLSPLKKPLKNLQSWLQGVIDKAQSTIDKLTFLNSHRPDDQQPGPTGEDKKRKEKDKGRRVRDEAIKHLRQNLTKARRRRLKRMYDVSLDQKLPRDVLAKEVRRQLDTNQWQGPKALTDKDSDDEDDGGKGGQQSQRRGMGGGGAPGPGVAGMAASVRSPSIPGFSALTGGQQNQQGQQARRAGAQARGGQQQGNRPAGLASALTGQYGPRTGGQQQGQQGQQGRRGRRSVDGAAAVRELRKQQASAQRAMSRAQPLLPKAYNAVRSDLIPPFVPTYSSSGTAGGGGGNAGVGAGGGGGDAGVGAGDGESGDGSSGDDSGIGQGPPGENRATVDTVQRDQGHWDITMNNSPTVTIQGSPNMSQSELRSALSAELENQSQSIINELVSIMRNDVDQPGESRTL